MTAPSHDGAPEGRASSPRPAPAERVSWRPSPAEGRAPEGPAAWIVSHTAPGAWVAVVSAHPDVALGLASAGARVVAVELEPAARDELELLA
ncbi:3-hydroxybutyrate dehydrogenase, partial [Myxococcota bacterium]|nr:3-hydroxybutyrate dehydrogenase [Myxococcota bacterium]